MFERLFFFLKVKKGLVFGRNERHRRKWKAGVTQFILKNWIMLYFKLVSTDPEINGNMCVLKCKHKLSFSLDECHGMWHHENIAIESQQILKFSFSLQFNVKISVVIAREVLGFFLSIG